MTTADNKRIEGRKDSRMSEEKAQGIEEFIARHTSLPLERAARIYRQGAPWPILGEAYDLVSQAEQSGTELTHYIAAMVPLIEMDVEIQEIKLRDYIAA